MTSWAEIWLARLTGPMAKKGAVALVDQGVVSGANFAVGVLLARFAALSEYGAYVLAFLALMFVKEFLGALITNPMTYLGPGREADALRRYVGTLAVVQGGAGLALAILVLVCATILAVQPVDAALVGALFGLAAAMLFVTLQDFCRRAFFMRLQAGGALVNDAILCGLQVVALVALWQLDRAGGGADDPWLTGRNAFFCLAASALVASGVGFYQLRNDIAPHIDGVAAILRENWRFGRWGMISIGVTLGYQQAIYLILGAFAGMEAVARFEGPRLIVMPAVVLMMAWGNLVAPAMAHKFTGEGVQSMVQFLRRSAVVPLVLIAGYLGVVLLFPGEAIAMLIGERYASETPVLLLWVGIVFAMIFSNAFSSVFGPVRRPELSTTCRAVGAAIGLPVAVVLISRFGAVGAVLTRLAVELAMALAAGILAVRLIRSLVKVTGR